MNASEVENAVKGLKEAQAASEKGLPPVEKWNPAFSHAIDMRIARDGSWYYMGSEITRERMLRLFSTILRRDEDGSFNLVTPAERATIEVEDVPFIAVSMEVAGEGEDAVLAFTTNVGDVTVAGAEHPLRFEIDPDTEEPAPYVHVRGGAGGGLEARLSRPVYYELADLAVEENIDGENWFGVWSSGTFFKMQRAETVGAHG